MDTATQLLLPPDDLGLPTHGVALQLRLWMRRYLQAFVYVLNIYTLLLAAVACAAVHMCLVNSWSYNVEFSLISLGLTFPVTFAIGQQFLRRERALTMLGELKASVIAIYWAHRDWAQGPTYPATLGNDNSTWAREVANVLMDFLDSAQKYIHCNDGYESLGEVKLAAKKRVGLDAFTNRVHLQGPDLCDSFMLRVGSISSRLPSTRHLLRAYACLSRLSVLNEHLTIKARYSRGGEGGMSRTAQYLRYLLAQFEQLRMIKLYRTPALLRYSCSLLVYVGCIALAPYFVFASKCEEAWPEGAPCVAPYVMAVIYTVITMLLLNVQAAGEDPFDGSGMDDVFVELTNEFADVLTVSEAVQLPVIDDDTPCFPTAAPGTAAAGSANPPNGRQ